MISGLGLLHSTMNPGPAPFWEFESRWLGAMLLAANFGVWDK